MRENIPMKSAFLISLERVSERHPKVVVLTTALVSSLLLWVSFNILGRNEELKEEHDRRYHENINFHKQIEQLTKTGESVKGLLKFIEHQKMQIQDTQAALENLKVESQKLRPIVESDKRVLENFLRFQEERVQVNIWKERLFGFISGVIASIVAAIFLKVYLTFIRKLRRA